MEADRSELEECQAALASIVEAFAMALAQHPAHEADALELMRMANAGEYVELAELGSDMCERIATDRAKWAH